MYSSGTETSLYVYEPFSNSGLVAIPFSLLVILATTLLFASYISNTAPAIGVFAVFYKFFGLAQ